MTARFLLLPLVVAATAALTACDPPQPGTTAAPADVAPATSQSIAAVQGSGDSSPMEGRTVTVEGVVTGRFQDGQGGVFLQSLRDDGDPSTSDALFVLPQRGQPDLDTRQHVRVTGVVAELDGRLTTVSAARVELLGIAALPSRVHLGAPPATGWESLEGMRIEIDVPLVVSGNDALTRFGEVTLAFGERLRIPTEVHSPGPEAQALAADNARRRLVLDDGQARQNPRHLRWLGEALSDDAPLRAGSLLHGVRGTLDERFGSYRLHLRSPVARIDQAPRPAVPAVPGDVRVAVMNLLNLFNGNGRGGDFPTPRGARSHDQYQRQLAKHIAAVRALDPHLVAVQELENDGDDTDSALAELLAALNAGEARGDWTAVRTEERPGSDQIRVALLYRRGSLQTVGRAALLRAGPFEYGSRVPVAQSFRAGRGPVFTVAVNHFKSKGGCEEARGADADQGDGQGCFNAQRLAAAEALNAWLASDPTGAGTERQLIVGDLNAYSQEDPVRALRAAGWVDAMGKDPAHSFVFGGAAGRLDHALLSPGLAKHLRGAAKWHSNSDESAYFSYIDDTDNDPWRAADHDPMLLGFDLR